MLWDMPVVSLSWICPSLFPDVRTWLWLHLFLIRCHLFGSAYTRDGPLQVVSNHRVVRTTMFQGCGGRRKAAIHIINHMIVKVGWEDIAK